MHSWILRHRRRLEQIYGLAPGRPARVPCAVEAAPDREPRPAAAGGRTSRRELRARVLVPAPRRAAS